MSATPVVPCDQVITGQPPFGGLPLGTLTDPEMASLAPCGVREE